MMDWRQILILILQMLIDLIDRGRLKVSPAQREQVKQLCHELENGHEVEAEAGAKAEADNARDNATA